MGTLFNQSERSYLHVTEDDLTGIIKTAEQAARKTGVSLDQAIRVMDIAERSRTNHLYVRDGDAKDEQLGGFGELIQEWIVYMKRLDDDRT